jgi:hypothetical protein
MGLPPSPLPGGSRCTAFATTVNFLEPDGRSWGDPDDATDFNIVPMLRLAKRSSRKSRGAGVTGLPSTRKIEARRHLNA